MTTATLGRIEEFDPTRNDLESYTERVEQYFVANDVTETKKPAVLLSVIGAKTYEVLKSLIAPEKPSSKTYDQLKSALLSHYKPKPLTIYERFKFHKAVQKETEDVSHYLARLRSLTNHCEFGQFLDDSLRDKFVCGLRNLKIQQRLLQTDKLTLKTAIDIAQTMENAELNARELHEQFTAKVHTVDKIDSKGHHKIKPTSRLGQGKSNQGPQRRCYRCGYTNHTADKCKYKGYFCNECKKKGHLAKVCQGKNQRSQASTKLIENDEADYLYHNTSNARKAFNILMEINGKEVKMEIDTGSGVTIMPESTFNEQFKNEIKLQKSTQILKTYSGSIIPLMGEATVNVKTKDGKIEKLRLLVAQVPHQSSVLGRDWLEQLKLDWTNVFTTGTSNVKTLNQVLNRHKALFSGGLGELRGTKAKIQLKENAQPKFFKPRPVPYAVKAKVEEELRKLENDNVISKVTHSEWAAPLVVVPKENGKVRLCGDFKVTINPMMKVDQYPLPTVQDLFATLSNGKKFTKLDLTQAYHQLAMEDESRKYVTINTHIGLFTYNRMPYGISSGPAIFQKNMEEILSGIEGVQVFIDDIRLTGSSDKQHLERLDKVLQRLEENGVKLNKDKCSFMQDKIDYLGHTINADGLQPQENKIRAMKQVSRPENVKELRSFLGGVQYYGKFLPNLSATLKPLNELLKKDTEWKWTDACEKCFNKVKDMLSSKTVLTHYDPQLPLLLATDASTKGLGAVLSHRMPNGEERPISFASRSLSKAEVDYAQIEKEALSIMFGIRKFHQYLYGRCFTLITDHKPLLKIFGPKTNLPSMAAARIHRWSVELCAYQYDIQYKRSEDHSNADMLSRLPEVQQQQQSQEENVYFSYINDMPVSAADIASETKKDTTLAKVLQFTLNGWPSHVDDEVLKPYLQRKEELTVESGVLQWGVRVIVPQKFRKRILDELHENHQGMNKTKAIARSYVYWHNMDSDIEEMIKECETCAKVKNNASSAPKFVWTFPSNPWERIHIDFADYEGQKYLVLIDAYSKWPEIVPMKTTTADKTNDVLRQIFAIHGLPATVVSDNGPPFTSVEFKNFLQTNGIKHLTSQPYAPATNGSAERLVQTFKQMLKSANPGQSGPQKLSKILLQLRTTPHAMTGKSPAELLFKRRLRIRLDLIKPGFTTEMRSKQEHQMQSENTKKLRSFQPGDKVKVRNYRPGFSKWSTGTILQRLGPVSYSVRVGAIVRHCHINQLQSAPQTTCDEQQVNDESLFPTPIWESPGEATPTAPSVKTTPRATQKSPTKDYNADARSSTQEPMTSQHHNPVPYGSTLESQRYPRRIRKPVDRLDL